MLSIIVAVHSQLWHIQLFLEGIRRASYEKIGMRDERIQAADREFYYTLRKREETVGDVRRCMVVGASFVHRLLQPLKK
jgi:hypothetical protein